MQAAPVVHLDHLLNQRSLARREVYSSRPMTSIIRCRYCGIPLSSSYEWELEALIASRSCLECVERIEKGDLIIQRRISTPKDQCDD